MQHWAWTILEVHLRMLLKYGPAPHPPTTVRPPSSTTYCSRRMGANMYMDMGMDMGMRWAIGNRGAWVALAPSRVRCACACVSVHVKSPCKRRACCGFRFVPFEYVCVRIRNTHGHGPRLFIITVQQERHALQSMRMRMMRQDMHSKV